MKILIALYIICFFGVPYIVGQWIMPTEPWALSWACGFMVTLSASAVTGAFIAGMFWIQDFFKGTIR